MTEALQLALLPETPEERAERIDAEILTLLMGKPGLRFGEELGPKERVVLSAIRYHRGHANAIKIDQIQAAAHISSRAIKGAVRQLRMGFGIPIGSWKHSERGGYFICISAEDIAIWKRDLRAQFQAELAVFRAAVSEEDALDLAKELWTGVAL